VVVDLGHTTPHYAWFGRRKVECYILLSFLRCSHWPNLSAVAAYSMSLFMSADVGWRFMSSEKFCRADLLVQHRTDKSALKHCRTQRKRRRQCRQQNFCRKRVADNIAGVLYVAIKCRRHFRSDFVSRQSRQVWTACKMSKSRQAISTFLKTNPGFNIRHKCTVVKHYKISHASEWNTIWEFTNFSPQVRFVWHAGDYELYDLWNRRGWMCRGQRWMQSICQVRELTWQF